MNKETLGFKSDIENAKIIKAATEIVETEFKQAEGHVVLIIKPIKQGTAKLVVEGYSNMDQATINLTVSSDLEVKIDSIIKFDGFDKQKLDDNTLMITGYRGSDVNVVIPNELVYKTSGKDEQGEDFFNYETLDVTQLDENAITLPSIRSVVIPDTVKKIHLFALYHAKNLTSITIGDDVNKSGSAINVAMKDNNFESISAFNTIYVKNNRAKGTYVYSDGEWKKE